MRQLKQNIPSIFLQLLLKQMGFFKEASLKNIFLIFIDIFSISILNNVNLEIEKMYFYMNIREDNGLFIPKEYGLIRIRLSFLALRE